MLSWGLSRTVACWAAHSVYVRTTVRCSQTALVARGWYISWFPRSMPASERHVYMTMCRAPVLAHVAGPARPGTMYVHVCMLIYAATKMLAVLHIPSVIYSTQARGSRGSDVNFGPGIWHCVDIYTAGG